MPIKTEDVNKGVEKIKETTSTLGEALEPSGPPKTQGDINRGAAGAGLAGAGTGAAAGAAVGAAFGPLAPIASAIGAALGAIAGFFAGFFAKWKKKPTDPAVLEEYDREFKAMQANIGGAIGKLPEPYRTKATEMLKAKLSVPWPGSPAKYGGAIWTAMREFDADIKKAGDKWLQEIKAEYERSPEYKQSLKKAGPSKAGTVVGVLVVLGLVGAGVAIAVKKSKAASAEPPRRQAA